MNIPGSPKKKTEKGYSKSKWVSQKYQKSPLIDQDHLDELLSKKPMMEFRGEGIYGITDVTKFIELLPVDVTEDKNPIVTMGAVKNEQELDLELLDEFRRTRPKKPFYKHGMGDRMLFIKEIDKYHDRRETMPT